MAASAAMQEPNLGLLHPHDEISRCKWLGGPYLADTFPSMPKQCHLQRFAWKLWQINSVLRNVHTMSILILIYMYFDPYIHVSLRRTGKAMGE